MILRDRDLVRTDAECAFAPILSETVCTENHQLERKSKLLLPLENSLHLSYENPNEVPSRSKARPVNLHSLPCLSFVRGKVVLPPIGLQIVLLA